MDSPISEAVLEAKEHYLKWNTKVIDIHKELISYNVSVDIYDPWAKKEEVKSTYGIDLIDNLDLSHYQAVILSVTHNECLNIDFKNLKSKDRFIFDTKQVIASDNIDARL